MRDSLDRIKGFAESKIKRDNGEMQKKLKGNSEKFVSSGIFTARKPRRRSMSLNTIHEEAMKHTYGWKKPRNRDRGDFLFPAKPWLKALQSARRKSEKRRKSLHVAVCAAGDERGMGLLH